MHSYRNLTGLIQSNPDLNGFQRVVSEAFHFLQNNAASGAQFVRVVVIIFIGEMTKGHKTVTTRRRVSDIKKVMPFKCDDVEPDTSSRFPRSWKQKQRSWMMAGLRKLAAPVVT